jgi:site-specific DNA-methyltransferase (adenine-specific)
VERRWKEVESKIKNIKKMKITDKIELTNEDNMLLMSRYPDNYFDLAIVDPPYGIDADKKNSNKKKQSKKSASMSKNYGNQEWDSEIPIDAYFDELKRVSKKQIIWGANFFGLKGGYLYWHKNVTMPTYSTGELAWLSWLNKLDFIDLTWHGMIQHDMQNKENRIHPTQKPVALYKWLLDKYAKDGDKILDTHLGSGSIAIACHEYGFELTACELDKEYFDKAVQRINNHVAQQKLF